MATLDELTTPLTRDEIEQAIYDAIEARGTQTSSWKTGAVARTIIAGTALVLSALSKLQQRIAESGFLELAANDWLTIVAREVYNVERNTGTFAAGNVTLDNSGGGVYVVAIGDLIVAKGIGGQQYRNTAAFTLAAFETGKVVPVQAIEIGSASSAAPSTIDTLVTVLLGVTVDNPAALVGLDPETDPDLRTRCLAKTGTLSPNGPADAYRFLALSAETDDGTPAGVTRVTTTPDGEGNVTVHVANASGPISGSIGDTSTALGAVDEAIQTQAVPLAVTATIVSATANTIAITYEIWFRSAIGQTAAQIETTIANALAVFMSAQPIGGSNKTGSPPNFVFKDAMEGVIAEAIGTTNLIDLEITVPVLDVPIVAGEAPVLGTVTATVNLVS